MQHDHYISQFYTKPGSFENLYSSRSSHQIWTTIIGILNLFLQAELFIVSLNIDNIFQIVKYLVNRRSAYTSCSCLPPYCLYDIPSMWPLPGECTYLPTCLHFPRWGISEDEEEKEKEDCQGQTANTGKNILNYLKLLLREEYDNTRCFCCFCLYKLSF